MNIMNNYMKNWKLLIEHMKIIQSMKIIIHSNISDRLLLINLVPSLYRQKRFDPVVRKYRSRCTEWELDDQL